MSSPDLTETDRSAGSAEPAADTPCPIIDSLEQIGSRWRLVVLYELQNGERRFNELKRETDANARTLSRVLDDLQDTGFVDRRMEADLLQPHRQRRVARARLRGDRRVGQRVARRV